MGVKNKKYKIIYADPPWEYRMFTKAGTGRTAASHYTTMRMVDIFELPVLNIAEKDCALFMWATYPALPEALHTIKAWGFDYKTVAFTWVKRNKSGEGWFWGMGSWTRANPEICLLATRGVPKRISASVHSIIDSRIREHSQKPDIVRNKIVELMGDLPRVELFARGNKNNDLFGYNTLNGWDVWGNEIEGSIKIEEHAQKNNNEAVEQNTTAQGCHLKSETATG